MKRGLFIILAIFIIWGGQLLANDKFVVVIDAGHGGKDPGAVRGTHKEKNINLGIALALGQLIENNCRDVKVIYTRKTDVFVELRDRAAIANRARANLFISIHTNSTAAKTTTASGADTYILGLTKSAENLAVAKRENSVVLMENDYKNQYEGFDPNSPESYIMFEFMTNKYMEQSLEFASFVQKDFRSVAKRIDRGVRQAGFLVLWRSAMPSVLIEVGFINNSTEAEFLSSKSGQNTMAKAIFSGFQNYKREFDKRQGKYTSVASVGNRVIESVDNESVKRNYFDEDSGVNSSLIVSQGNEVVDEGNHSLAHRIKPIQPQPVNTESSAKRPVQGIGYSVQFLISTKKLPDNSAQFKGLSPVSYYIENGMYKYFYGSSTNMNGILKVQAKVRTKFKDAFVVKLKDGKRIK